MKIISTKDAIKVTVHTTTLKFIIGLVFGLSLLVVGSSLVGNRGNVQNLFESRSVLAKQLDGAYPRETKPSGIIKKFSLRAFESVVEIVPGFKTKVWSYDGHIPGPTYKIKLGDTIQVTFTNNLPDETTIHWHGVRVPNAMDGVPGVTQPAIKPGETFVYKFTPKDAGTFWFHPHVRGSQQLEMGLVGVLIVEDEYSKKYDKDITWVVDDWLLDKGNQVSPYFNTFMQLMHDGRWGNVITVNGEVKQVLKVRPGERIRLRLVNTSNARVYDLSLPGLDAKVIAVDGMYVKKTFDPGGFLLSPGNRLDLDIKIPVDGDTEFKVKDMFGRYENILGTIKVTGNPVKTKDFAYPINKNIPDWRNAVNIKVDKEYRLGARRGGQFGIEWTINEKAFPQYDPFDIKYNEFTKIKFVNESSRIHPMHLHGQFFKVLTKNGKSVDEPYFRDTVLLGPNDTVEIGLVAYDKGSWVMHCHILEHAESGMLTVVNVK